jgi:hypothetical protein
VGFEIPLNLPLLKGEESLLGAYFHCSCVRLRRMGNSYEHRLCFNVTLNEVKGLPRVDSSVVSLLQNDIKVAIFILRSVYCKILMTNYVENAVWTGGGNIVLLIDGVKYELWTPPGDSRGEFKRGEAPLYNLPSPARRGAGVRS